MTVLNKCAAKPGVAVRDADVPGVYSPNTAHAEAAAAARARELRVGNARAFESIEEITNIAPYLHNGGW